MTPIVMPWHHEEPKPIVEPDPVLSEEAWAMHGDICVASTLLCNAVAAEQHEYDERLRVLHTVALALRDGHRVSVAITRSVK